MPSRKALFLRWFLVLIMFFFVCIKAEHIFHLHWPAASNFCGMYGERRRVGLPTSTARARVRRLTPTDRYPRDSKPGPLDLKFSILLLSYRPPSFGRKHQTAFFQLGNYPGCVIFGFVFCLCIIAHFVSKTFGRTRRF